MSARKRFLLRLEPELYEVLQRWAADELRSVNGQMEFLLKQAAQRAGRLGPRGAARAPSGGAGAPSGGAGAPSGGTEDAPEDVAAGGDEEA